LQKISNEIGTVVESDVFDDLTGIDFLESEKNMLPLMSTRILGFIHELAKSNSSQRSQSIDAIIFAYFAYFAARILPLHVCGH